MYGRNLINGSVEWLGVPSFVCDDGTSWTENILAPIPCWGVGGTFENWDLGIQPGSRYGSVDVPWRGAIPARLSYLPQSQENTRANARRVRDNILWEHYLACTQSLSYSYHIPHEELVNRMDFALDDLWDKPAPQ